MKWLRFGLGFGFGLGYTNPNPNPKQVSTMKVGDSLTGVAIDAGFGEYSERACATLGIEQAPAGLKAGMEVMLQVPGGKQRARVTEMTDTSFTLDANHPLAGKKLELDVELLSVDAGADAHETATFAGGCFWGVELAFQREPGVVGTKVGYCQGDAQEPSYEQVCTGATGHTEAVRVVFDPKVVTYGRLCELLVDRLGENVWLENQVGNDRGTQYRSGAYYVDAEQKALIEASKAAYEGAMKAKGFGPITTEVAAASDYAQLFYYGEDYHQQYLAKPGARPYCSAQPRCVSLPAFESWCPPGLEHHAPKLPEAFWAQHGPKPHCVIRSPNPPIVFP